MLQLKNRMKYKIVIPIFLLIFTLAPSFSIGTQVVYGENNDEARNQRIADRKQRIKLKLDQSQKNRILNRCEAAQKFLSNRLSKAEKFNEKHDKRLDDLISKISDILQNLEEKGKDISAAKDTLGKIKANNESLQSIYEKYYSSLSDTVELDCANDPEGFKASLEDTRELFDDLKNSRVELRKSITTDLKSNLEFIIEEKL